MTFGRMAVCGLAGLLLAVRSGTAQDKKTEAPEEVLALANGEIHRGRCESLGKDRMLTFRGPHGSRTFFLEDVQSVTFKKYSPDSSKRSYPQVRLTNGQSLQAKSLGMSGRVLEAEADLVGRLAIKMDRVRNIIFSKLDEYPSLKAIPRGKADLLVKNDLRRGEVIRFDADRLAWSVDSREESVPMSSVRAMFFPPEQPGRFPTGWYAHLLLENGDGYHGVLEELSDRWVRLYSHDVGPVRIPRTSLVHIKFTPQLSAWQGYVLLGGQGSVSEIDAYTGEVLWSNKTVGFASSIMKLSNGNVLITDQSYGRVVEMDSKGDIVWEKGDLQTPWSSQELENGNIFIATYMGQLMEIKKSDKSVVWEQAAQSYLPRHARRLPDKNVLITSTDYQRVYEIDENGKEVWHVDRSHVGGGSFMPLRSYRMENGNTLIVDSGSQKLIEMGPDRKVKSSIPMSGITDAVRLPDGNTLMLNAAQRKLVEYGPDGKSLRELRITGTPYTLHAY